MPEQCWSACKRCSMFTSRPEPALELRADPYPSISCQSPTFGLLSSRDHLRCE